MNDPLFTLRDCTVECELFFPTRFLLRLLWLRAIGWNSNALLKINVARVDIVNR